MTRLPSLASLHLLRLAAQHRSLSVAAEKAGLTQSAASRRLAGLEDMLGIPLLRRHRRGVELTEAGAAFLASVQPALDIIAGATQALHGENRSGPLRLRVYATFAARWLLPRLPDFQARHPGIEVRLDTSVAPVAFDRDDADLAIQFGDGRWPGTLSHLLIADLIEPICTPGFAAEHGLSPGTSSLSGLRLIDSRYRRADWRDWGAASGISTGGAAMMLLPNSLLAYQAAAEGLGMAMGQTLLLRDELARGALVTPFARPVSRELGYYLVAPRGAEPARSRTFRDWLVRAVR